jgi:uncharacterized protein
MLLVKCAAGHLIDSNPYFAGTLNGLVDGNAAISPLGPPIYSYITEFSPMTTNTYECDFGATLFASHRVFESPIYDKWVLFAPDRAGLPILVSSRVRSILHGFRDGATAGTAVAHAQTAGADLEEALSTIAFLEEHGFISDSPAPTRYTAADPATSTLQGFEIWLHINNYCNLDCDYCFVDRSKVAMTREVMADTISRIASTVKSRGLKRVNLKFAGGEPTLSVPALEWFHDRLLAELAETDVEVQTSVLSNGTIVSDRLVAFLKRPNCGIGLSLDGYGADSHDIYRVYKESRQGSWARIMKNIDSLMSCGIRPYIMATISERTCGTLVELVRWIFSNGLRTRLSVVRQPSEDSFRANGYADGLVQLTMRGESLPGNIRGEYAQLCDAMKVAFDNAFDELEKANYRIDLRDGLGLCELHFDKPVYTSCCGIGTSHVVIQEDGRLASCPMTLRESEITPGDDLLSSIRETFLHSPTERNAAAGRNCLDCRWFPVCVSGCPVNNDRMTGTPFTLSPLHEFYEFVIPRYIVFVGRKLYQYANELPWLTNESIVSFDDTLYAHRSCAEVCNG